MATEQGLDPRRTVIMPMDFQNGIVDTVATDPAGVVERASRALAVARGAGVPVLYVVHRGGRFAEGGPDAEIAPALAPREGEQVLAKTKAGAFSTTGLDVVLRELGRDSLVLLGVATSGCVLSTLRWAADTGYAVTVVADACDDRDPEVHRVLTEKVFPRQAQVVSVEDFARMLAPA